VGSYQRRDPPGLAFDLLVGEAQDSVAPVLEPSLAIGVSG
jgi:hypothetical protein